MALRGSTRNDAGVVLAVLISAAVSLRFTSALRGITGILENPRDSCRHATWAYCEERVPNPAHNATSYARFGPGGHTMTCPEFWHDLEGPTNEAQRQNAASILGTANGCVPPGDLDSHQSPIDIKRWRPFWWNFDRSPFGDLRKLMFETDPCDKFTMGRNGFTWEVHVLAAVGFLGMCCAGLTPLQTCVCAHARSQVDFDPSCYADGSRRNVVIYEAQVYRLIGIQFRAESEHRIDGANGSLEVQLVHKTDRGEIMIIAALFVVKDEPDPEDGGNAFLSSLWALGFKGQEIGNTPLRPYNDLLPFQGAGGYARYNGSLTYPPCKPHVSWFVYTDMQTIREEQLELMLSSLDQLCQTAVGMRRNSRGPQPRNNRRIYYYLGPCLPFGNFKGCVYEIGIEGVIIICSLGFMLIMVVAHWILEECRRNQVKRQMQGQSSALAKIPIVGKAMDGNVILSTAALGVETAFTVITYPFRIRSRVRERARRVELEDAAVQAALQSQEK